MEVYQPAEDSEFLSQILKKNITKKSIKCLDLGTGSGIQSRTLLKIGIPKENITATDVNPNALKEAKKLGIRTIKSNLFESLKRKVFDLIIFNPPYLPESHYDDKQDTTGGKNGDEVIIEFIKNLKQHLTKSGKSFLLTSSLTPEKNWQEISKYQNLKFKKIATKKIFFEELYVWEIKF